MVVLGGMTLGGVVKPVEDLAGSLQMAFDSGAKRVLLPMSSATDIATVPPELFAKFQISFFSDPIDAVYKALGVMVNSPIRRMAWLSSVCTGSVWRFFSNSSIPASAFSRHGSRR